MVVVLVYREASFDNWVALAILLAVAVGSMFFKIAGRHEVAARLSMDGKGIYFGRFAKVFLPWSSITDCEVESSFGWRGKQEEIKLLMTDGSIRKIGGVKGHDLSVICQEIKLHLRRTKENR